MKYFTLVYFLFPLISIYSQKNTLNSNAMQSWKIGDSWSVEVKNYAVSTTVNMPSQVKLAKPKLAQTFELLICVVDTVTIEKDSLIVLSIEPDTTIYQMSEIEHLIGFTMRDFRNIYSSIELLIDKNSGTTHSVMLYISDSVGGSKKLLKQISPHSHSPFPFIHPMISGPPFLRALPIFWPPKFFNVDISKPQIDTTLFQQIDTSLFQIKEYYQNDTLVQEIMLRDYPQIEFNNFHTFYWSKESDWWVRYTYRHSNGYGVITDAIIVR